MNDILLTIIIPCFNAEPYINELLDNLKPQITKEVQVLIIDDGSEIPFKTDYDWVTVIRQNNSGASAARNTGLDNAIGEYIAFIDADDMIANNYISSIINKIKKEKFDYCYLSWRTLPGGWQQSVKLTSIYDIFPPFNLCVWNRIYRRDMIGDVRFNVKKLIAEDAEFIRAVKEEGKKKAYIDEYMYFYRSSTPNSLTKRFADGQVDTKRVVYYYPKVTSDMTWLIEDFKETDKEAEVILMTNENQIPELNKYAMVLKPCAMKGTELRGTPTTLFTKINPPINTQVVVYTQKTFAIGGIETWIYNFCTQMYRHYDILVLYDVMDEKQIERLRKFVRVEKNSGMITINCDTLIMNRITDTEPSNVYYKQKIQMVHACKMLDGWHVPKDNDCVVPVSNVAYESFKKDIEGKYEVINNMTAPSDVEGALLLVSATRLDTFEKGKERILRLAKLFKDNDIPFVWLIFSNSTLPQHEMTEGMFCMSPRLNISQYIKQADYLVQLSDQEGFCYSIVEAWELGVPVLTTNVNVLPEIGFKEGENGYIVPFDIPDDYDVNRIYHERLKGKFKYKYDNESRVKQWKGLLGDTTPKGDYKPEAEVCIKITNGYKDIELGRLVKAGEILSLRRSRARQIEGAGLGIIIQ